MGKVAQLMRLADAASEAANYQEAARLYKEAVDLEKDDKRRTKLLKKVKKAEEDERVAGRIAATLQLPASGQSLTRDHNNNPSSSVTGAGSAAAGDIDIDAAAGQGTAPPRASGSLSRLGR
jgi:hypothetical protein